MIETSEPLRVGMLLWEPADGRPGNVWCVSAVDASSATLLTSTDDLPVQAALNRCTMPEGWRLVRNRRLWESIDVTDSVRAAA